MKSMGQSPWDDIKTLGHCSESVCLSVGVSVCTKWDDVKNLGCPMLVRMRVCTWEGASGGGRKGEGLRHAGWARVERTWVECQVVRSVTD